MWYYRLQDCRKSIKGISKALSDRPRSGRPSKIERKILEEARLWCEGRAFTSAELCDQLEDLSGVRLSLCQVRRYAKRWGCSRKKTQPIKVNTASMKKVYNWRYRLLIRMAKYKKLGYAILTQDECHFMDGILATKYWAKKNQRIFMTWTGGFKRFSMLCSMTDDGRTFFNHCDIVNTESFLEHMDRVYKKVGKMVLVADKASWHTSVEAKKFFRERDIIIILYPTGHPYLNPVEEVWSVLKRSMDSSVRYADLTTHLTATYKFISNHKFDYNFSQFWKRRRQKGVLLPIVREEQPSDTVAQHKVGKSKRKRKSKSKKQK